MKRITTANWKDYELIDSGNGQRLERFGPHTTVRPDPNVIWEPSDVKDSRWDNPDLRYDPVTKEWLGKTKLLDGWEVNYGKATFSVRPNSFRHLGIFPEQAAHWDWLKEKIHSTDRQLKVLNLFAYTGAASVLAALEGAEVCHVDASKASIYKAKENAAKSGLSDTAIRWIVDDVIKFLKREVRRGNTYDVIMMDPPVFGRGPKGEIWRLEEGIGELLSLAVALFSNQPAAFLFNFYATSLYPESVLRLATAAGLPFEMELGELCLQESSAGGTLQTGFFIRS